MGNMGGATAIAGTSASRVGTGVVSAHASSNDGLVDEGTVRSKTPAQTDPHGSAEGNDDQKLDLSIDSAESTGRYHEVIDTYEGIIERIDGDVAIVVLEHEDGTRFCGEKPIAEFGQYGLGEGDTFICKTVRTATGTDVVVEPELPSTIDERAVDAAARNAERIFGVNPLADTES
jgi:hypothetical protein